MKINLKVMILMAIFIALMAMTAFIKIPFIVPITFQLFVAVASGIFLGPIYGPFAMAIYVVAGLVGLPVFANGGGIAYVVSPTFGFIVGFVIASFVAGILWADNWGRRIAAIILATIACYIPGIPYFWIFYGMTKGMTIVAATVFNLPYLAKDVVLGGILFGFAQTMGRVAPELMWKNRKTQTLS